MQRVLVPALVVTACVVAGPGSFAENQAGVDLAVLSDGRVLALERGGRVIKVFAPNPQEAP